MAIFSFNNCDQKQLIGSLDFSHVEQLTNVLFDILDAIQSNVLSMPSLYYIDEKGYWLKGIALCSASNTLESSLHCAKIAHFADAVFLLRKYRDDILQFIWVYQVINKEDVSLRKMGYSEEELKKVFNNKDVDTIIKIMAIYFHNNFNEGLKSVDKKAVDQWIQNTLVDNQDIQHKYFKASKYKNYLSSENDAIRDVFANLTFRNSGKKDNVWSFVDRLNNNFAHSNGEKYIFINALDGLNVDEAKNVFKDYELALEGISVLLLMILILTNPLFIQSSDYMDALDIGVQPIEDSQYFILPLVQDFMNNYFKDFIIKKKKAMEVD